MKGRWSRLSHKERILYCLLFAFMFMGFYGLVIYPPTYRKLVHTENMIHRRLDRIAKRTSVNMKNVLNPKLVEGRLKKVDEEIRRLEEQLRLSDGRFMDSDDFAKRHEIIAAISRLAVDSGLFVDNIHFSESQESVKNYRRGRIEMSAYGTYSSLRKFVERLKELPYAVAVINMTVTRRADKGKSNGKSSVLDIEMSLVV